jgi:branched-chain amino acid transport system permease protein
MGLVAVLLALLAPPATAAAPPAAALPVTQDAGTSGVRGTLRNGQEPVVGAKIVVEQDGEEVGEGETDERGAFLIELPSGGEYVVRLDLESLPEGVSIREEGGEERTVTVREGSVAPALFILGEGGRDTASKFDEFLQLLVGGFQFGLVIAMAAIGCR